MSVTASIHIHPEAHMEGEPSSGNRGYVRIQTDGPDRFSNYASIHAGAPDLRRLASACLRLAAELDPPAPVYRDDFANGLALASYGAMHDREGETPRMGENR